MRFTQRILFPFAAIFLLACFFTPYLLKIEHGIFEHKEVLCTESGELHFHEIELDCDFYKFQLKQLFHPAFNAPKVQVHIPPKKRLIDHYCYLSKYQKLHFVLRGPPVV